MIEVCHGQKRLAGKKTAGHCPLFFRKTKVPVVLLGF